MKTTGIAIKWGGMWEDAGERGKARECYELGWREVVQLLEGQEKEGSKEVMKGVAMAMKIGDLWVEEGRKGDGEAEKYYVWCVEEMMKLGMTEAQKSKVEEEVTHGIVAGKEEDKGMELPKWLGQVELVAGFERLGELYARAGNTERVLPPFRLRTSLTTRTQVRPTSPPTSHRDPPPPSSQRRSRPPNPTHRNPVPRRDPRPSSFPPPIPTNLAKRADEQPLLLSRLRPLPHPRFHRTSLSLGPTSLDRLSTMSERIRPLTEG